MAGFKWSRSQVVLSRRSFDIADQIGGPFNPVVQKTDDGYHIWMNQTFVSGIVEIWHGVSDDGLHFRELCKAFGPDVFPGDKLRVGSPTFLWEGAHYRIWFYVFDGRNRRIFTAISPDGLTIQTPELAIDVGSCPPYDNQYTYGMSPTNLPVA